MRGAISVEEHVDLRVEGKGTARRGTEGKNAPWIETRAHEMRGVSRGDEIATDFSCLRS